MSTKSSNKSASTDSTAGVKLTYRARLRLTAIVNQQVGTPDESDIWADIGQKIDLSKDERASFIKDLGAGQLIVDEDLIDAEPATATVLERAERRMLLEALKKWRAYDRFDPRWRRPVMTDLENSLLERA